MAPLIGGNPIPTSPGSWPPGVSCSPRLSSPGWRLPKVATHVVAEMALSYTITLSGTSRCLFPLHGYGCKQLPGEKGINYFYLFYSCRYPLFWFFFAGTYFFLQVPTFSFFIFAGTYFYFLFLQVPIFFADTTHLHLPGGAIEKMHTPTYIF